MLALLAGCFSLKQSPQKISYYSLEYELAMEIGTRNPKLPLPCVIRVERFQTAPFYDTAKIVFQEEAFERDAYFYHRWWAKPGDIVSYFLARDMKAAGAFQAVFSFDKGLPASYRVEGVVDEFFEQDKGSIREAVLSVSITLLAEDEPDVTQQILLQKIYSARETCTHKTPKALAEAMSRAMQQISGRVINDICLMLA